jgi:hypothetical protein
MLSVVVVAAVAGVVVAVETEVAAIEAVGVVPGMVVPGMVVQKVAAAAPEMAVQETVVAIDNRRGSAGRFIRCWPYIASQSDRSGVVRCLWGGIFAIVCCAIVRTAQFRL